MNFLDLWLPVVVSAFACWIASFVLWIVLPFHNKTITGLGENEDAFLADLRSRGVEPGMYCFPHCDGPAEMKEPAYVAKVEAGPVGFLHIWARTRPFALCVGLTFVVMLLISATVAYLATLTAIAPGAEFLTILRFVGTAAFLGYAFGGLSDSIWFGKSPKVIGLALIDAFLYACLTGAAFGLLWPGALDAANLPVG